MPPNNPRKNQPPCGETPITIKQITANSHLVLTVLLAILLVPCFLVLGIPFNFSWRTFIGLYWSASGQSILFAALLYVVGDTKSFIKAISTSRKNTGFPTKEAIAVAIPAIYFFLVFFLVMCYNDVIALRTFDGSYDAVLTSFDKLLLFGTNLPQLVQSITGNLGISWLRFLEILYFGMFPQIGACVIFLALKDGLRESFRFISALATAYYLALFLFVLVPATGPYFTNGSLTVSNDPDAIITVTQQFETARLRELSSRHVPKEISTDYYIALPSMHIVQPLIILWFFRKTPRIFWILVALDLAVLASVILLNQHYLLDILAAFPVALYAIGMTDGFSCNNTRRILAH